MTYLELARSALSHREQSEKSPSATTPGQVKATLECEISELCEKSPVPDTARYLTSAKAEELKALIIAAVTVEPEEFDREQYEALLARWNVSEAAVAGQYGDERVA